jgi:hypothetical protein
MKTITADDQQSPARIEILQSIKDPPWSFAMVARTGFLLLVSLIVNAVLAAKEMRGPGGTLKTHSRALKTLA